MYFYLWEYRVHPGHVDRFLEHYGPEGTWARLFRSSSGYEGTTLLRDMTDDHVFVTIDSWASEAAYRAFRTEKDAEFKTLDSACEDLTVWEKELGNYLSAGAI
jgi:heme-degrading monooxygenase HmoA